MTPTREKVLELCSGNEGAADFVMRLWLLAGVWDDAVDDDKTREVDEIHTAMMWSLFGLHDSEFYRAHAAVLRPAMLQAIASWMVSCRFEKSGDPLKLEQAYFMRCAPYDVFGVVALLVGGFNKQVEAVEYFRTVAPDDSLDAYKKEHSWAG